MNILKFITIIVAGTGLIAYLLFLDSNFSNLENGQKPITDLGTDKKTYSDVKIPLGNEIDLKVEVIGRLKALLTVSNNSSDAVFLSFLAGKDKYAFAVYQVERRDELSGEFKALPYGHFGPGIHPLESGDFFKSEFIALEKGIYRINVHYSIDRQLAEETIRRSTLNTEQILKGEKEFKYDKEFSEKRDLSIATVTSKPFEL